MRKETSLYSYGVIILLEGAPHGQVEPGHGITQVSLLSGVNTVQPHPIEDILHQMVVSMH